MSSYLRAQATAKRLIASKGFAATFRSAGTPTNPVSGVAGVGGEDRTVSAVKVSADSTTFPETLIERSTCMLLCAGAVGVSDRWVDGDTVRAVLAVSRVEPNNATLIISKVLIGG
jgi:hypothetical protein